MFGGIFHGLSKRRRITRDLGRAFVSGEGRDHRGDARSSEGTGGPSIPVFDPVFHGNRDAQRHLAEDAAAQRRQALATRIEQYGGPVVNFGEFLQTVSQQDKNNDREGIAPIYIIFAERFRNSRVLRQRLREFLDYFDGNL